MRIAYLHYHLKPGGVTSVIKHQINAVKMSCETILISSHQPDFYIADNITAIPLLAYNSDINKEFNSQELAHSIMSALPRNWDREGDILHVHNPTLAKNSKLLPALSVLRDKGFRLLLQIHDFAEDGRPGMYSHEEYIANVHYGVINSRDYNILLKAGLKKEGLHLIENRVEPFDIKNGKSDGFVLYPIRAIRRKNIGECVLFSLFLKRGQTIGITLPPNSKKDTEMYRNWKRFVDEHRMNLEFDVGMKQNFVKLVKHAPYIITTSVNEAFGFTYLESWTAKKMLLGRCLPDICCDFMAKNIDLDHLYRAFHVPLDYIDDEAFYKKWKALLMKHYRFFKQEVDPKKIDDAFEWIVQSDKVDFGYLDEGFQMELIRSIINNKKRYTAIQELNPWLLNLDNLIASQATISHNNQAVRQYFNDGKYAQYLLQVYDKVVTTDVEQSINKKSLIRSFLKPREFKLLQWDYE